MKSIIWKAAPISDCRILPIRFHADERGWLAELFRFDELDEAVRPVMSYLSLTHAGVTRGPHEHRDQTDIFAFFDGTFRLFLWDARPHSPSFGNRQVGTFGRAHPAIVSVPPGIVHGYRNVGTTDALIVNCPNRLYGGWGRGDEVDEIRHEDHPDSPFEMD